MKALIILNEPPGTAPNARSTDCASLNSSRGTRTSRSTSSSWPTPRARGLSADELVDGVHRSDMNELGTWTVEADKVIVV